MAADTAALELRESRHAKDIQRLAAAASRAWLSRWSCRPGVSLAWCSIRQKAIFWGDFGRVIDVSAQADQVSRKLVASRCRLTGTATLPGCRMRLLIALSLLQMSVSAPFPTEPLPSRSLDASGVVVPHVEPISFDLLDYRIERRGPAVSRTDAPAHSIFGIKQHLGFAAGYDYGVVHGAIGLYITIAEWGRWNFGVPSPELGFGRYPAYDIRHNRYFVKDESSLFISLASVHYRVAYLQSFGVNWYINIEQMFDMRQNAAGSQVGFSFSPK